MSNAGLTNGAFYAHFASKEDLVGNVLADQLQLPRALTGRDLSDQLLARGAQTALALLDDRASNAGVTREQARACGVIGAAVASSVSGRLSPVGDLRGGGARGRPRARRVGSHPSAGWARARGRSASRPPWR
jgi:AcrR family transcriptional regulator